MNNSIDKLPNIVEKYTKLKQEGIRCKQLGDYDGDYNVFCKINNLFHPKYQTPLERFKTEYE